MTPRVQRVHRGHFKKNLRLQNFEYLKSLCKRSYLGGQQRCNSTINHSLVKRRMLRRDNNPACNGTVFDIQINMSHFELSRRKYNLWCIDIFLSRNVLKNGTFFKHCEWFPQTHHFTTTSSNASVKKVMKSCLHCCGYAPLEPHLDNWQPTEATAVLYAPRVDHNTCDKKWHKWAWVQC